MSNIFSPLEISAIGEVSNIAMGSSATAISNMLDHRVDITTPTVSVVNAEDFQLGPMEPAIGVEIKYVSGVTGSNIMVLKLSDIKVIVDILMGTETPDEEFEMNELTLSAVCEVMNQMMGSAATSLSDFLGYSVNISTPETFEVEDLEEFKNKRLPVPKGPIVIVKFALDIEPSLKSEFMNVMSVELAKELVAGFGLDIGDEPAPAPAPAPEPAGSSGGTLSQEEIEKLMAGGAAQSAPAPAAPAASSSGGTLSQEEIEKLMAGGAAQSAPAQPAAVQQPPAQMPPQAMPAGQPPMQMPQYPYPPMQGQPDGQYPYYYMPPYGWAPPPNYPPQAPEPKVISTQTPSMPNLSGEALGEEQAQNLDLIMSVPLEITVEIGRAKRKVQDILSFAKGSLVVLDKLAGDQVDLFVNGKCIARGEVVVIDDNFGIRIGEILHKPDLEDISAAQK